MTNIHSVHMVGIGGIGVSALAQLYVSRGVRVSGSDREGSPVVDMLQKKGISVSLGHETSEISQEVDLLVYSDAVPDDNRERRIAQERGIRTCSYFEALGDATKEGLSIVVAGTHGKSTTTAMLGKVLIDTGKNPTVVAGSILAEQGSNFVAGRDDVFLLEGCEYKRHFLHLHPTILVINNIELDHTDYFKDLEDMQSAFREVAERVPSSGAIITNTDDANIVSILHGLEARIVPYQNCTVPHLTVPGAFNRLNAAAAKTTAYAYDADLHEADIDTALTHFSGTWRRFEYRGCTAGGADVYDDYAHHPSAMQKTLTMMREEFPGKRIVVLFHPHLYSRTKQFFEEFAKALSVADIAYVLPIYAAREVHDASVRSEKLAEAVSARGGTGAFMPDFVTAQEKLALHDDTSVVVTMGAGDVYRVADALVAHT